MKKPSILKALMFALPASLLAAADTSILLIGNPRIAEGEATGVTGGARAIIKEAGGETKVKADEIKFDRSKNTLICVGDSIVEVGGRVLKGKDISIDLGESTVRVFAAQSDGVLLLGGKPGFESFSTGSQFAPLFNERLPSFDLDLKRSRTRR